jgi:hypothetical protein
MAKVHQVIVRNTPEKGLDVVKTTLIGNQVHDISPFLPSGQPSDLSDVYLTKFKYSPSKIALRFTFDDGLDQFGRELIKTHTLIIDSAFYHEKTIQYFISPLINGSMSTENHNILKTNEFVAIDPYPISSKLVELSLSKKQVRLTSQSKLDSTDIIQLFSTIDRIFPPPLNLAFSFQTMAMPSIEKSYKGRSLVYSPKELPQIKLIEQLQNEKSEYLTIRDLTDALFDLSSLRQLQRELFLGIPEKKLRFKIHFRFGRKTFSKIRENLDYYFPL